MMLTRETLLLVDLPAGDFCSSNASSRHPQDSSEIKHGKLDKHQSTMQVKVGGESRVAFLWGQAGGTPGP